VVPISYYASEGEAKKLLSGVNGVLFTGGGSELSPVHSVIWEEALSANDRGEYFPIWGTCLGLEFLVELAGGVLDGGYATENMTLPLIFTEQAKSSKMLADMPSDLLTMLADPSQTSAFNAHHNGIDVKNFYKYDSLYTTFNVLASSIDPVTGREFVAVIESEQYPFYGVQWHPEKNVFELGMDPDGTPHEAIVHSPAAISATLNLAEFFVGEAKKNQRSFPSEGEEAAHLIWNYPVYGDVGAKFVQVYVGSFRTSTTEETSMA